MTLKTAIISLLESGTGIGIEVCGYLSLEPLEDGRFRIFDQRDLRGDLTDGTEEVFDTAEAAADRFLALREDRRLGFDFEHSRPA